MIVIVNILWIIFAYLIGSINFSILLTYFSKDKKNIKEVGSGNAGATNAMRAYGFKFGFLIFILDTSKSFWFGFSTGLLQNNFEAFATLIPQLALLFVIIGHIFPIYFKFKGGKGAATLLGMIASISLILAALGTILFLIIVFKTKYVSLGSIIVPYILFAFSFLIPLWNYIDTTIHYGSFWFSPIFLLVASIIVTISHYKNIKRLIQKRENEISFSLKKVSSDKEKLRPVQQINSSTINGNNESKKKNEKETSLLDSSLK